MENNSSDCDVKELLQAAEYIARKAQDVKIEENNIKKVAANITSEFVKDNEKILKQLYNVFWRPETYPDVTDSKAVDWLFVLHTLNFSLFNPKGTKQWTAGNSDGYNALCFAIKRAIDEKKPLWNPYYYTKITECTLKHIFRSDDGKTDIPLLRERCQILHAVGKVLLNKYKGTFVECVKLSNYNSDNLMKILFYEFEPYRDEAIYEGKHVRLLTKANSLVSDIWACYRKNKLFRLNIHNMMSTIFIDYHSPTVLHHLRILDYSNRLLNKFKDSDAPLKHGSREELEIRGCSLLAVNKLYTCVLQKY
ncbi:queuosine salvage protein-like [Nylanderia fulva]|uniref:queuosine salvage protein-like n=1 Tax=Nylanderia fulva TaxID=613905 RepID=UPI0010FB0655|nr:queuosine salvage protein-like [Nylanderia fulva]